MKTTRQTTGDRHINGWKHQQGVTLIELLVAGVISLIVVSGMVIVMATTLGTGTQTIEMARLTQGMRTAMQIMTRELRRANYHPGFVSCYGNTGCLGSGGLNIDTRISNIQIGNSVTTDDCFWFWYDRLQACTTSSCTSAQLAAIQTPITTESVAAFRLSESNGVGTIQMTTTRTDAAVCSATSDDWVGITDPNIIDVETFVVSNTASIVETINAAGDTQNIEKIELTMTAKLTADASVPMWIQGSANATRQLVDFIVVRNRTTTAVSAP